MSNKSETNEDMDFLDFIMLYCTEEPSWCLAQTSKYGYPTLLKVRSIENGIAHVIEYSFGELSYHIDESCILIYGNRSELLAKLNAHVELDTLSFKIKNEL